MKDYHINELGERAQDGFAYQVADNVGLQYGLNALQAGRITPEQFVDLNEKVGGLDIAGNYQSAAHGRRHRGPRSGCIKRA